MDMNVFLFAYVQILFPSAFPGSVEGTIYLWILFTQYLIFHLTSRLGVLDH